MAVEDGSGPLEPRAGKAGASAFAFYEEQRKAWIRRNRRVFMWLNVVTGLLIVASFVVWRVLPASGWYAGLVAGMALSFNVGARVNPPGWIENWQAGGFGEQRTARELTELGDDWLVLHDLPRANHSNVDHVVVGPAGVFLLDTKNLGAEVRINGDELVVYRPDGRERYRHSNYPVQVRGAAAALSDALRAAGATCWVNAVIVVWGDMTDAHVAASRLDWVAGKELVSWLQARPIDRNADRISRVTQVLAEGGIKF